MADALAGQEEAADDHGDLCARGRAIGVKIPAVFAGEDARGVHSLHRLAELRIHGVQIRDGLVVDRGQILCAQHIRKQARQLLPGDGLRRDGTSVRARGGQELRFRGIGDIWLVPRAAGLGDLAVVAGGVDARGNGNGLCPGDGLLRGEARLPRAVHDPAAGNGLHAGCIPAAGRNIGKRTGLRVLRILKGGKSFRSQRGHGQRKAEQQRQKGKEFSVHHGSSLIGYICIIHQTL